MKFLTAFISIALMRNLRLSGNDFKVGCVDGKGCVVLYTTILHHERNYCQIMECKRERDTGVKNKMSWGSYLEIQFCTNTSTNSIELVLLSRSNRVLCGLVTEFKKSAIM